MPSKIEVGELRVADVVEVGRVGQDDIDLLSS
jgi:hypothetical protein